MDLSQEEIDLIVKALKDSIVEGYEIDYEMTGIQSTSPTREDEAKNKELRKLIKKLKPPVPREKKPEVPWRDKKRTEKQTQVIEAFGQKARGLSRGEASDKITEIVKSYTAKTVDEAYARYTEERKHYIYETSEAEEDYDDWNGANYDGWQEDSPF